MFHLWSFDVEARSRQSLVPCGKTYTITCQLNDTTLVPKVYSRILLEVLSVKLLIIKMNELHKGNIEKKIIIIYIFTLI